MAKAERIPPHEAHDRIRRGAKLICAYADRDKCEELKIPDAIPLEDLQSRADNLPRDEELIFYCN